MGVLKVLKSGKVVLRTFTFTVYILIWKNYCFKKNISDSLLASILALLLWVYTHIQGSDYFLTIEM